MFRDLKEYQEIAKLYAEKVSKTEDLDENRNTRGQELAAKRLADKPKTREEVGLKPKVTSFADRRAARTGVTKPEKKLPTTAEIRAKSTTGMSNIPSKEGNAVINGKKLNPDFGKKVDIKKEFPDKKPEVSTMTKQGKPRTKAQMMAAKRIASGKSIDDVKAANTASMKAKASERNQKFQDAKKSGNLAQFRKDNPKMSGADRAKAMAKARLAKKAAMEEYTPYDIVLEYLLSTEQVATIEEANYVMTEMDGKTIQSVVKEVMGGVPGDGYIGHPRLKFENPFSPPKKETKKTTGKGSKKGVQGLGNRATEIEDMIKGI